VVTWTNSRDAPPGSRRHGFYRGAGLFRVSRILPVEKLKAKFEIVTNVYLRGPPHRLWRPKPSVHLATPHKNSFDRGGFGKIAKIYG
jgi:hypothetical protein